MLAATITVSALTSIFPMVSVFTILLSIWSVGQSIDGNGNVAGYFSDANGVSRGFLRDAYGNFSILNAVPYAMGHNEVTTGYVPGP